VAQLHLSSVKSFLDKTLSRKYLLFCFFVFLIVMLTGIREPNSVKDINAVRHEQYRRYALLSKHRLNVDHKNCPFWRSENSLLPKAFTLSVVAVENYVRPPLRRWVEEIVARTNFHLLGRIPDFSFGIGQVRLSTAKLLVQQGTAKKTLVTYDDKELLELILNPCENISLVNEYLSLLIKKSGFNHFDREAAFVILGQYNGQQESDQHNQIYQEVVWETFLLYQSSLRN
jgi:hypothetical protein